MFFQLNPSDSFPKTIIYALYFSLTELFVQPNAIILSKLSTLEYP
jgi:hypothetical protein